MVFGAPLTALLDSSHLLLFSRILMLLWFLLFTEFLFSSSLSGLTMPNGF